IDFQKTYPFDRHTGVWRVPHAEKGYVIQKANGWINLDFPYPENTAYYALTHVTVSEDTEALLHARADDTFKAFVNDQLLNSMEDMGTNGSDYTYYRDRWAEVPDEMAFPIQLKKGRNKILIKITNEWGACGFVVALSKRNQEPLENISFDIEPPPTSVVKAESPKWKKSTVLQFQQKGSEQSVDRKVGNLDIKQKVLVGISTEKQVAWRKYTVRPGFPKDSPSNLFWLPKNLTQQGEDFMLGVQIICKNIPKFTITFDGEGNSDGLSGWTLIFHEAGGKLQVNLEKYDTIFYESPRTELKKTEEYQVIAEYYQGKLTLQVNEGTLFNQLSIMPITLKESHRIGFCTWGPEVSFKSIVLKK
ncbi:MAG: hypothetical protein AABZ60_12730, partial [Planctomycetota bacterium]